MKNKVIITLIFETLSILNSQEVSFRELLPQSEGIYEKEFLYGNSGNEQNIMGTEAKIKVDSDAPIVMGTLKSKFEKITKKTFIPPGTKLVKGRIIDNKVEKAR